MKGDLAEIIPFDRPKSLNDMAYQSLKEGILKGILKTGEVYSELELARRFRISRTPVREALIRLSAENLIVFHPRKGISVISFSQKDIENLYELRGMIEETAILKISTHLTLEQIQEIKQLISEQEKCMASDYYDEDLFLDIDRKLHLLFIEASENPFFVKPYNSIRDCMDLSNKKGLKKKGRGHEVIEEHRAILKALIQRDGKKVKKALEKHLIKSKMAAYENVSL
jgi:DNA-binding GntR family transcriptional regulator